jgi:hypothetical protein
MATQTKRTVKRNGRGFEGIRPRFPRLSVFYLKPLRGGTSLVEWPLQEHMRQPGGRLAAPESFKYGDPVLFEVADLNDHASDPAQVQGTVRAVCAMVVQHGNGKVSLIDWDGGRLDYVEPTEFDLTAGLERAFELSDQ